MKRRLGLRFVGSLILATLLLGSWLLVGPARATPASPGWAGASGGCGVGSWDQKRAFPVPVAGAAVASQGGMVYSFGGTITGTQASNIAYKYDPGTDSWMTLAPLPAPRSIASAVS